MLTGDSRQLCTFKLGDLLFGIDVRCIQEVIRYQEMTRVPLAVPVIRGLINLRGQIVTAIDTRRRLGLTDREGSELPMNIVVRLAEGVVSLLVDEIGDVVEVSERDFETAPETLPTAVRDVVRGVYKTPGRLLLLLDHDHATTVGDTKVEAAA